MTGRPRRVLDFQRILDHCSDGAGRLPYKEKAPGEIFSTRHLGQRKLLLSEIEFLCLTDKDLHYTAVYAGAAPGTHIPLLAELFPHVLFHLFDPQPFDITETERIKLHSCYFTDGVARSFRGTENLLFVSDIRRTFAEEEVWVDMLAQQRWHEIMRSELTMLKFRLPWVQEGHDPIVHYLDGAIHLPVWGRTSTTESRLIIDARRHAGTRPYNCHVYEQEMSFFNRVTRPSVHTRAVPRHGREYDACYDCTAEIHILRAYIVGGFGRMQWPDTQALSRLISRRLGREIPFN